MTQGLVELLLMRGEGAALWSVRFYMRYSVGDGRRGEDFKVDTVCDGGGGVHEGHRGRSVTRGI